MSHDLENPLTYRQLYESPLVSVSDYSCRADRSGPTPEEQSNVNNIVIMRQGAFCKHFGRRSVTADVNQAVFFSKGSTYRVSHPVDCGDRGVVFHPTPRLLNDIIRELDPSIDEHPERPFPFVTGPCDSGVYWRLHELVEKLEAATIIPLEPLWADVTALQLTADVLEAAFTRHDLRRQPRRHETQTEHTARVEAAKNFLASRMNERITLEDVALAAGASPYHLTRIFQQQTGAPVHRYLTQLRLRASLDRLADGANDLTELALELGFSSHSHFTDTFRREFGRKPSDVRRNAGRRLLGEMSKILEV